MAWAFISLEVKAVRKEILASLWQLSQRAGLLTGEFPGLSPSYSRIVLNVVSTDVSANSS